MTPANTPTLKIESLSYSGGRGVGRLDGLVVFVPGTAPGDVVQIRITAQKPRFCEAEVVDWIERSPHRRVPPCAVADRCGGCAWQHVEYGEQVRQKEKIVRDALRGLARRQSFEWRGMIPAAHEFHYRNRVQLQVRNGRFGFFAKGTRELVEIKTCWIAESKLNERMKTLSSVDLEAAKVELAVRPDGTVVVMAGKRDAEEALFSQVNTAQNSKLIEIVLDAVAEAPAWIMDLYCGDGNFTVPLANKFPRVSITSVDLSRASIARAAKVPNVTFIAEDVGRFLSKRPVPEGLGLVVLDPPRAGVDRTVIQHLSRLKPHEILYVSCNPTTFNRDVERLWDGGSYRVSWVRGLDMFPQTEHVEIVASLCAAP